MIKQDRGKVMAFEMRCYRRILHIRWQQKIRNVEVRKRMQSNRNMAQVVMERKEIEIGFGGGGGGT